MWMSLLLPSGSLNLPPAHSRAGSC